MGRYRHTRRDDVITVPKALEKKYDADPNWKRVTKAPPKETSANKTTAAKTAAKK